MIRLFGAVLFAVAWVAAISGCALIRREPVTESKRVAVYSEALPGVDRSISKGIARFLRQRGRAAELLSTKDLARADVFSPSRISILVLPESQTFPAEAVGDVQRFLRAGGHVVFLNGPAFSNPCWKLRHGPFSEWKDLKTLEREREEIGRPEQMVLTFEPESQINPSKFLRDAADPQTRSIPEIVADGAAGTGHSLRVTLEDFQGWDTFAMPLYNRPKADHTVTSFWAKGDERTTMLSLEWREKDGSRWIAAIPLTPSWKRYVLPRSEFQYWHASATGTRRGGAGDVFHPESVVTFRAGLALSHTFVPSGRHVFWIDEVGVMRDTAPEGPAAFAAPVLDTISPSYKMYPVHNLESMRVSPFAPGVLLESEKCIDNAPFSPIHRPLGTGYGNKRFERFIPVVTALDRNGLPSGTLAHLTLNLDGELGKSILGGITFGNPAAYKDPAVLEILEQMLERMEQGLFLAEAGSNLFAYFEDAEKVVVGAQVANLSGATQESKVRFRVEPLPNGKPVLEREMAISASVGLENHIETSWPSPQFDSDWYRVTVDLLTSDTLVDQLTHEFSVWKKPANPKYMTARDGKFHLPDSKEPWVPFGVNYMPSYLIAVEDRDFFEHFLDPRDYDPEIVQADLLRIRNVLGMNMVNVFIYAGRPYNLNLVDLLNRCRKLGLRVNLALRPYANPVEFKWDSVEELFSRYRIDEQDIIFAHDIAWEPWWGGYDKRRVWDPEWERWILEQYGSLRVAEADWGILVPRTAEGIVTGPSDKQLENDGDWTAMVAAYRRFVDDFLNRKYTYAMRKIKERDPHHLVSFRMSEAGNPRCAQGGYPYDLRSVAKAVDLFEPEGYGRFGYLYDHARTGVFTAWYARSLVNKPVMWAEFGISLWNRSNFQPSDALRGVGADGYDNFLRMIIESRSSGGSAWYYPGGYRFDERSDFGLLDPDGSPRPHQEAFTKYAKTLMREDPGAPPLDFKPDVWLAYDRDKHAAGISGIYKELKADFWKLADQGKVVGLRPEDMGTLSVNTPLTAVGNRPYSGHNPVKSLNASFDLVRVKDATGRWAEVEDGSTVEVKKGEPLEASIVVGNTGDATWVAPTPQSPQYSGKVYVATPAVSNVQGRFAIPHDVHYGEVAELKGIRLIETTSGPTKIVLRMEARDRAAFGEIFEFRIEPK